MYGMEYMYEDEILTSFLTGFTSMLQIPSTLLSIAGYVLTALAFYTIAKRRGLKNPWLAWIPGINCWLLGSLSDQYQYVVNHENKSKRKVLLTLYICEIAIYLVMIVLAVIMVVQGVIGFSSRGFNEDALLGMILGPTLGILGLCLPLIGVSIAYMILYYMALYDVYKSLDPSNCVLFLVLSIIFSVTAPFFLFFNRDKDLGMPPRRPEPQPQIPPQFWQNQNQNKDYL